MVKKEKADLPRLYEVGPRRKPKSSVPSSKRTLRVALAFFLLLEIDEQFGEPLERLFGIRAYGFEFDPASAIQVGAQYLQDTSRRKGFPLLTNRHFALKLLHRSDKLSRRSCVQPEFVQDLDFSPHVLINDDNAPAPHSKLFVHKLHIVPESTS